MQSIHQSPIPPRSEPTISWESHSDPCLPNLGVTRDLWEYTSPEGWTHVVYINHQKSADIHQREPYSVVWITPEYKHYEYQMPDGDFDVGPHITPEQTRLHAATYEGSRTLAKSFRDEISSATGSAHTDIDGIVNRVDEQNADRTSIQDYLADWEAAIEERDAWEEERGEIHGRARDEYAMVCKRRRELLAELESNTTDIVPLPDIVNSDQHDGLIEQYAGGDLNIREFEAELESCLEFDDSRMQ